MEKILDITQKEDSLLLFFEEGVDLQSIINRQKDLQDEDKERELKYYDISIDTFSFLGNKYSCINLRFDNEINEAVSEKRRLGF